jgi:ankyrin repeat protein
MDGQKDEHEDFFKTLRKGGKIDSILSYLRHNGNKVLFEHEHKSKMSPLHVAAMIGNESLAEFMINRQVPIDQRDKLLKTPLHHACEKGHQTMAELLLKQGASIYCQDSKGFTAFHYAIQTGNNHILSLLTDKDAAMIFMPDFA